MRNLVQSAKLVYLALMLATPSAFALSVFCPDLGGVFKCGSGAATYKMRVMQSDVNFDRQYIFQSAEGADQVVVTDQVARPYRTTSARGTFFAHCDDNQLLINFMLRDKSGNSYQFQDSIYIERGALVRVRLSLPGSASNLNQSSVCQRL